MTTIWAFFDGVYDNLWDRIFPYQYLGEYEYISFNSNNVVLKAPAAHKDAIIHFMKVFPRCNKDQQKAFMKIGFDLLEIETV